MYKYTPNRLPWGLSGKESACNAEDVSSILGLGRTPGEGNGNPLQYSCLGNSMDRGAWPSAVHGVTRVGHNLATKTTYQSPWVRKRKKIEISVFLDTSQLVVQHFTLKMVTSACFCWLCEGYLSNLFSYFIKTHVTKSLLRFILFLCFSFEKWGTWPASRSSFCRQGALFSETGVQFIQRESGERTQQPFRETHAGPASTG